MTGVLLDSGYIALDRSSSRDGCSPLRIEDCLDAATCSALAHQSISFWPPVPIGCRIGGRACPDLAVFFKGQSCVHAGLFSPEEIAPHANQE